MKDQSRKFFAIVVIFLIAHQDLCYGKAVKPKQLIQVSKEDFGEIVQSHARRNKRAIGAVLMGVAIFASVANIAFDVYLQVEGCCGLYPDACEYEKKFDTTLANIETTSANIDSKWLASTNLLTYINSVSTRNEEIALELKRITESYENIIETVDTETRNKYNNISAELENAVNNKNQTVLTWSYADVDTQFTSLFDTSLGRLQILSGLIGQVATGALGYVWNWYKTAKIQTMLRTTYGQQLTNIDNSKFMKVVGAGDDINSFLKDTAVARRSAEVSVSRGSTAIKVAAGVMSVVQIGIEIWMAVLKVEQCKTVRNNVRDAYNKIQPEYVNISRLYDEVVDNYNNMSSTWTFLDGELKSDDFLGYLSQIKNLSDSADSQTTNSASASATIQNFIDVIGSTTEMKDVYDLQGGLISALENVTYVLSCLSKKVKTYQVSADRCASGTGTLTEIYNTAVSDFDTNENDCTQEGMEYTTYASVETYVKEQASTYGFNSDCPLNDAVKQAYVCSLVCDGKSDSEIATAAAITTDYVTKFKANCSVCPLPDADKTRICMLKSAGFTVEMVISFYPDYDSGLVTAAYNECA